MILIITAGVVALLGTLIGTRIFIGFLVRRGYGQFVRDDGPKTHGNKRGTPTMGGAVIVGSALLAYALAHLVNWELPSYSGLLLLGLLVACGQGKIDPQSVPALLETCDRRAVPAVTAPAQGLAMVSVVYP